MARLDITEVLNARFRCARCHAAGSWTQVATPVVRQNSSIHTLNCTQCGECIVAKVGEVEDRNDSECAQLREEYETLRTLRREFPQDEQFGTLDPLGYLKASGRGVMITRWVPGEDLVCHARMLRTLAVEEAFQRSGVWLRKLHDAGRVNPAMQSLGVEEKVEDLLRTYGAVLRVDRKTRQACDLLASEGPGLSALSVCAARLHGDFKPQNVLYDGTRCVGLDIHWNSVAAVIYDIAPFLNHLWLARLGIFDVRSEKRRVRAERGFLDGYGDLDETRALRWAQLYFALCHLGGYRQRGALMAGYARWKVWPLVQTLSSQL